MELEAQNFFENLDFDEMNYYYHITGQGNGKKIMENGLYLEVDKLSSTLNELTSADIDDVEEFITKRGNQINENNQEMVIIGCCKDETPFLIKKSNKSQDYVIASDFVIGYIQIDETSFSHSVIINPHYIEMFDFLTR